MQILRGFASIRSVRSGLLHHVVDVPREHRADRMNGFMAIEPFRLQSQRRTSHRQLVVGNLVLDDGMNNRVRRLACGALTDTAVIGQDRSMRCCSSRASQRSGISATIASYLRIGRFVRLMSDVELSERQAAPHPIAQEFRRSRHPESLRSTMVTGSARDGRSLRHHLRASQTHRLNLDAHGAPRACR
jgi:hypothetical protein